MSLEKDISKILRKISQKYKEMENIKMWLRNRQDEIRRIGVCLHKSSDGINRKKIVNIYRSDIFPELNLAKYFSRFNIKM